MNLENIQNKKDEGLVLYQNIIIERNTTYIKDTLNVWRQQNSSILKKELSMLVKRPLKDF